MNSQIQKYEERKKVLEKQKVKLVEQVEETENRIKKREEDVKKVNTFIHVV